MPVIHTKTLSSSQAKSLTDLFAACRAAEGLTLGNPTDGDEFFLLFSDQAPNTLESAVAVYRDEGLWELRGFTLPSCRRRGYFSLLMEYVTAAAENEPEGQPDLCFSTDEKSADAIQTLKALDCVLWYQEYIMTRSLMRELPSDPESEQLSVRSYLLQQQAELKAYLKDGRPAASCRLLIEGSHACLYDVTVAQGLRGQGIGTRFMKSLLSHCRGLGIVALSLQVNSQNQPALRLYKKTGFSITQTLSYYLY